MAAERERARGSSSASLQPHEAMLAQPPSPARVRGQRASLRTRAPSYNGHDHDHGKKPEPEIPKLAGEQFDEFGLPIRKARKSWVEDDAPPKEEGGGDTAKKGEDDADADSDAAFESAEEDVPRDVHTQKEADPAAAAQERPATPAAPADAAPPEMTPEQVRKERDERFAKMVEPATAKLEAIGGVSAASHQAQAAKPAGDKEDEEDEWQAMRAYGKFDVYDDEGQLVARGMEDSDDDDDLLGGARKGYTKLQLNDDAESVNSIEEDTEYLFKSKKAEGAAAADDEKQGYDDNDDDEDARDPLQQMQATKDMLTEGQRIAYVGLTRLSVAAMARDLDAADSKNKSTRAMHLAAVEAMKMWGQKMMMRQYAHMEIEASEQVMIEQLTEHGVQPADLTPALMQNARVKNPMAEKGGASPNPGSQLPSPNPGSQLPSPKPGSQQHSPYLGSQLPSPNPGSRPDSPRAPVPARRPSADSEAAKAEAEPPPAYELHKDDELTVQSPGMMPTTQKIDIDIRWTVLCDLFLILIADSVYDARSRQLLETVGAALEVSWIDICRFEKRVTDALEMQEEASREQWDEADNVETRRKMALKRRYIMMGLATVGGTLVIGLSAGLLAPVIGAGLGAGFTAIGVAGTTGFMAGAGGAAIITTASATAGGVIAVRASSRRMGAVKTFEYRPLHNNKRVNLVVTVSGWMNGKVDDVRLPFSTVDPIMGDIYSLLWEPDVLKSTGDTIRILATEALTQGLQQVLAATFLTTLMAGLSLPLVLSKLSYLLDNPWSTSLDRADAAGLILADSLVDRNLGVRPITLVGFSLGARVIFSCLRELARKGAVGLVQNVYLFGSPVIASREEYLRARTVVAGRFLNGFSTNDWILGYLFRATAGGIGRVAGLAAVEGVAGIENVNLTHLVAGHMAYRAAMPRLLREAGWEVESDEFAEIEDPDPENHEARQRELIREIDSARQQASAQMPAEKRGRWTSFWARRREKKGWETYDVQQQASAERDAGRATGESDGVLFDIDAIRRELESDSIRRELESEQMEVRQLESTLPPMRLDMQARAAPAEPAPLPVAQQADKKKKDTPKLAADKWAEYDEGADGDMRGGGFTMTFDHADTPGWGIPPAAASSPHLAPSPRLDVSRSPSRGSGRSSPARSTGSAENGWADERWGADRPQQQQQPPQQYRPQQPQPQPKPEFNAWAADDEPGHGGDGEVQMTFE